MFALPETITVWNPTDNDGFGGASWTEPVQYPARVTIRPEKMTDRSGDDFVSAAVAYSEGATLQENSRVTFTASIELLPPADAHDVRRVSQIPSGAGALKKVWLS